MTWAATAVWTDHGHGVCCDSCECWNVEVLSHWSCTPSDEFALQWMSLGRFGQRTSTSRISVQMDYGGVCCNSCGCRSDKPLIMHSKCQWVLPCKWVRESLAIGYLTLRAVVSFQWQCLWWMILVEDSGDWQRPGILFELESTPHTSQLQPEWDPCCHMRFPY